MQPGLLLGCAWRADMARSAMQIHFLLQLEGRQEGGSSGNSRQRERRAPASSTLVADIYDSKTTHTHEAPYHFSSLNQGFACAAGGATGEVIIWDFETKGVARASQPHDQAVTAVAWTRDGRHVISASEDCTVSSLSILDNKQVQSPSLPCLGTLLAA